MGQQCPQQAGLGCSETVPIKLHCEPSGACGLQTPAKPPPGHLMTLPESSRKALDAAFKQSSKPMTASELLTIIGLPNVAMKPPGPGPAGAPSSSNPPATTPTWSVTQRRLNELRLDIDLGLVLLGANSAL